MKYPRNTLNRAYLEKHWPNDPANGDDDDYPEEEEPDYSAIYEQQKEAQEDHNRTCCETRAVEACGSH